MKIAVACENEEVTKHFGHCQNYKLYEIEDNQIVKEHNIPNPGHETGFLPRFLGDMHVTTIISGGMGNKAVEIFNERDIDVVIGASGDAKKAALAYLNGELKSSKAPCLHD